MMKKFCSVLLVVALITTGTQAVAQQPDSLSRVILHSKTVDAHAIYKKNKWKDRECLDEIWREISSQEAFKGQGVQHSEVKFSKAYYQAKEWKKRAQWARDRGFIPIFVGGGGLIISGMLNFMQGLNSGGASPEFGAGTKILGGTFLVGLATVLVGQATIWVSDWVAGVNEKQLVNMVFTRRLRDGSINQVLLKGVKASHQAEIARRLQSLEAGFRSSSQEAERRETERRRRERENDGYSQVLASLEEIQKKDDFWSARKMLIELKGNIEAGRIVLNPHRRVFLTNRLNKIAEVAIDIQQLQRHIAVLVQDAQERSGAS